MSLGLNGHWFFFFGGCHTKKKPHFEQKGKAWRHGSKWDLATHLHTTNCRFDPKT